MMTVLMKLIILSIDRSRRVLDHTATASRCMNVGGMGSGIIVVVGGGSGGEIVG